MRRLTRRALMALPVTAGLMACRREYHPNPAATIEEPDHFVPYIQFSDPIASQQILTGFHSLEGGSWRWAMQNFSVALAPPDHAATQPVQLEMKFVWPENLAQELKTVTIRARVQGQAVPSITVTRAGEGTYSVPVPKAALTADIVKVDFELDHVSRSEGPGGRELGLVVAAIGFKQA